jgi:hypothetical protein
MQVTLPNLLARVMRLENLVFGNNGEIIHKLTLNGNIVNQGGNLVAGYSMRPCGLWVDIFGTLNSNPTPGTSTITTGTSLFTLPAGYRPTATTGFPASGFALNNAGYIQVGTNGVGTWTGPTVTALILAGAIPLTTPV